MLIENFGPKLRTTIQGSYLRLKVFTQRVCVIVNYRSLNLIIKFFPILVYKFSN